MGQQPIIFSFLGIFEKEKREEKDQEKMNVGRFYSKIKKNKP